MKQKIIKLAILIAILLGLAVLIRSFGVGTIATAWALEWFTPTWFKVLTGNAAYAVFNLTMAVVTYRVLDRVLLGKLRIADEIKNGNWTVTFFVTIVMAAVILSGRTAIGADRTPLIAAQPYLATIKTAHNRYFGRGSEVPNRLIVSQFYQESRFDPTAESNVGARGIAQIMPGTQGDIERQLGPFNAFNARDSIYAGTYYIADRWTIFRHGTKTVANRMAFAQAAYNAGLGYVLQAQELAEDSQSWLPVSEALYKVPRVIAEEPVTYVRLIFERYNGVFKLPRDPVLEVS